MFNSTVQINDQKKELMSCLMLVGTWILYGLYSLLSVCAPLPL